MRTNAPKHLFLWPLSAYDEHHHLLPEINPGPLAAPGSGDKKVQAYNFRLILTNDPANRLPFPRPKGYDRASSLCWNDISMSFSKHMGRAPGFRDVTNPVMIPNHKADFNNNGPFSTDYIGHSWKYPEASYAGKGAHLAGSLAVHKILLVFSFA